MNPNAPNNDFLDMLYEEQTERVAGCFVADDRQQPEISVHLRGWRHRDTDSRRTWLFVQVRVSGRLAHELELSKADAAPVSLNLLLRNYLCAAPQTSASVTSRPSGCVALSLSACPVR